MRIGARGPRNRSKMSVLRLAAAAARVFSKHQCDFESGGVPRSPICSQTALAYSWITPRAHLACGMVESTEKNREMQHAVLEIKSIKNQCIIISAKYRKPKETGMESRFGSPIRAALAQTEAEKQPGVREPVQKQRPKKTSKNRYVGEKSACKLKGKS